MSSSADLDLSSTLAVSLMCSIALFSVVLVLMLIALTGRFHRHVALVRLYFGVVAMLCVFRIVKLSVPQMVRPLSLSVTRAPVISTIMIA